MDSAFSKIAVLIAGCFVHANAFAVVLVFGSLYVPLLDKFREDRASTATVQSTFMGVTMSTAVVWSLVSRKIGLSRLVLSGCWLTSAGFALSFFATSILQLVILIGVISGMGVSIMHVGSSIAVQRAFDGKGKSVAMSVHQMFIGLGTLAYPFLLDYLVGEYHITGTLLILGGINLNNIAVALVICFTDDDQVEQKKDINKNDVILDDVHVAVEVGRRNACLTWLSDVSGYLKKLFSSILSVRLITTIVATGISVSSVNGFLVVVLDVFASKGFTASQELVGFMAFNIGTIVGRVLPALFQMKCTISPIYVCVISCTCGCAGQLLVGLSPDVHLVYAGSGLTGVAVGGSISGATVALVNIAPAGRFDEVLGILITTTGILSSVSGPFYGWLRDELQSYAVATIINSAMLGGGALLYLVAVCVRQPTADTELEIGQK